MIWTKKGTIIVFLAALSMLVIFYFSGVFTTKAADPWLMIPENAALVVEVEQPKALFETISDGNEFWKSLLSLEQLKEINSTLLKIDSLSLLENSKPGALFSSSMLLSLYPSPDSTGFSYLISISDKHLRENDDLLTWANLISNSSLKAVKTSKFKNAIFIKNNSVQRGAYALVFKKNLLITPDDLLLTNIINQNSISEYHFSNSFQFQQLRQTAGKNVLAHIFVNYRNLHALIEQSVKVGKHGSIDWLREFAAWSVLDLFVKKDEILLSGYTSFDNSTQFLGRFANEVPVENTIFQMIPGNSTFLMNLGLRDFPKMIGSVELNDLKKETGLEIEYLVSSFGDEACLAATGPANGQFAERSMLMIKLRDKQEASKYLDQLADKSENAIFKYNDLIFKKIDYPHFIDRVIDYPMQEVDKNWFVISGNYVVFAASPATLVDYFTSLGTGKTLDKNENFAAFSPNLAKASNITILIYREELKAFAEYFFKKPQTKKNSFFETISNSLNYIAVQFSAYEPFFYTNFAANHSKNFKEETPYLWAFSLESEAASEIFFLNNSENILVSDDLFTLYSINSQGNLNWKKRIDSPILGEIHEISNPGDLLLFNTSDYLYLLGKDGEALPGFPVKLSSPATNGHSFYRNANDYRIVIAQSDKKIHNYTMQGSPVEGWKLPKTDNRVSKPVTPLLTNNKILLLVEDDAGNVIVLDKFGLKINLKNSFVKAQNSDFYVNKTNNKGEIVTSDQQGKLTYIAGNGKIQFTDFGKFSPGHYFLYEDFNGDGETNFIYLDGNKLSIFDRFKKKIFSYTFNSKVDLKPLFVKIDKKQRLLAIIAEPENAVYLFDNKGKLTVFPNYPKGAAFVLHSDTSGNVSLVCADGNSLYFYRIQ